MLGTADELRRDERDNGDIDPRRLGLVVLAAALMAAGVGAGVWLTGSGDRPIADTSIVNVVRPRHDRPAPAPRAPDIAPVEQLPAAPALPAPNPALPPAAPHPVEVPVVVGPAVAALDPPVPDLPAQPSD